VTHRKGLAGELFGVKGSGGDGTTKEVPKKIDFEQPSSKKGGANIKWARRGSAIRSTAPNKWQVYQWIERGVGTDSFRSKQSTANHRSA